MAKVNAYKIFYLGVFLLLTSLFLCTHAQPIHPLANKKSTAQSLIIKKKKLSELPKVSAPLQIEILDLRQNNIEVIGDEIIQFKNLKSLRLGRNPLQKISEKISELKALEYLDLWDTDISELPESIFKMKHLKEIDIRLCPIHKSVIERLIDELPDTKILFSYDCNC